MRALILCAALTASIAQTRTPPSNESVLYRTELPSTYRLTRVTLRVDGMIRYDGATPFVAPLPPGPHLVEVVADYQLHDPVLTYVDHMAVQLKSAHHVVPPRAAGEKLSVVARAVPVGDATTPVARRAAIDWMDVVTR